MKWPAIVLADLRSAAIRTEDFAVPGMIYATLVSGRSPRPKSFRGHREALCASSAGAGAGAVILMSPFKATVSLASG